MRRWVWLVAAAMAVTGCSSAGDTTSAATPSPTAASPSAKASPSPSPAASPTHLTAAEAKKALDLSLIPVKDGNEGGWHMSLDTTKPKNAAQFCGTTALPAATKVLATHQRLWGNTTSGFAEIVYVVDGGEPVTSALAVAASDKAKVCKTYKANGLTFTSGNITTPDMFSGIRPSVVICGAASSQHQCTAVVARGSVVVVAYTWFRTRADVDQSLLWLMNEIQPKLWEASGGVNAR